MTPSWKDMPATRAVHKSLVRTINFLVSLRWSLVGRPSFSGLERGHKNFTYRGVSMMKNPIDLALIQMILFLEKPQVVVEIGSRTGASALWLYDQLKTFGIEAKIFSIDIVDKVDEVVRNNPNISFYFEGWEGFDLSQLPTGKTLVIDDGSHIAKDVFGALEKFTPAVSPGSLYIVEDGALLKSGQGWRYGGGPVKAVRDFMAKNPGVYLEERLWNDFFGKNSSGNWRGYLRVSNQGTR